MEHGRQGPGGVALVIGTVDKAINGDPAASQSPRGPTYIIEDSQKLSLDAHSTIDRRRLLDAARDLVHEVLLGRYANWW